MRFVYDILFIFNSINRMILTVHLKILKQIYIQTLIQNKYEQYYEKSRIIKVINTELQLIQCQLRNRVFTYCTFFFSDTMCFVLYFISYFNFLCNLFSIFIHFLFQFFFIFLVLNSLFFYILTLSSFIYFIYNF